MTWHHINITFNSYNVELLLSFLGKMLVLVVAERSSSPVPPPPTPPTPPPPPPYRPSSQQLQQQWANRCLRECPLRCPSCQNHPRPWRPQCQLFPWRLHSPHHHHPLASSPISFPYTSLPFTREIQSYKAAAAKEKKIFKKKKQESKCTQPQSILRLHQNIKVWGSDENTKRGRDEQTMLLPMGVCKSVNKGFL